MAETKRIMSPQQILNELQQIKAVITDEKLTQDGEKAILEQVNKIETLLLELKEIYSAKNKPDEIKA